MPPRESSEAMVTMHSGYCARPVRFWAMATPSCGADPAALATTLERITLKVSSFSYEVSSTILTTTFFSSSPCPKTTFDPAGSGTKSRPGAAVMLTASTSHSSDPTHPSKRRTVTSTCPALSTTVACDSSSLKPSVPGLSSSTIVTRTYDLPPSSNSSGSPVGWAVAPAAPLANCGLDRVTVKYLRKKEGEKSVVGEAVVSHSSHGQCSGSRSSRSTHSSSSISSSSMMSMDTFCSSWPSLKVSHPFFILKSSSGVAVPPSVS